MNLSGQLGLEKPQQMKWLREVHAYVRGLLVDLFGDAAGSGIRILYGGSMKLENAAGLLAQPDADGGLIGVLRLMQNLFVRSLTRHSMRKVSRFQGILFLNF